MFPSKEIAISELELAGKMNPGLWVNHSYNVANAAKIIAEHCDNLDSEKAFVCGLLHDIGRRTGIAAVILCDVLADANGFCILEKRFIDTTRRYGIYPFSIERWNKTYEYKEYFEKIIGKSIYSILPDIEKCIYC